MSKFTIHFCIIAEGSSWGETALCSTFINALSKQIKDQLATRDIPADLDSVISFAIRIDIRVRESLLENDYNSRECLLPGSINLASTDSPPEPEPMQIGWTRLSRGATPPPQCQHLFVLWEKGSCNHCLLPTGKRQSPPVIQELLVGTTSLTPESNLSLPVIILY